MLSTKADGARVIHQASRPSQRLELYGTIEPKAEIAEKAKKTHPVPRHLRLLATLLFSPGGTRRAGAR